VVADITTLTRTVVEQELVTVSIVAPEFLDKVTQAGSPDAAWAAGAQGIITDAMIKAPPTAVFRAALLIRIATVSSLVCRERQSRRSPREHRHYETCLYV
jgi:hypothetical protein